MRFRLRTLLIALALVPPLAAGIVLLLTSFFRAPDLFSTDVRTGAWPETPLQLHAYQNDIVGLQRELAKAATIEEPDIRGWTALHWAVKGNSRQAVQVLLERGASEEVRDNFGYSPIDYARDQIVRELLETAARKDDKANEDAG